MNSVSFPRSQSDSVRPSATTIVRAYGSQSNTTRLWFPVLFTQINVMILRRFVVNGCCQGVYVCHVLFLGTSCERYHSYAGHFHLSSCRCSNGNCVFVRTVSSCDCVFMRTVSSYEMNIINGVIVLRSCNRSSFLVYNAGPVNVLRTWTLYGQMKADEVGRIT